MTRYVNYFKGKFLISKIVATVVILGLAILRDQDLISNMLNIILTMVTLISFFIIDSNLRKSE